MLMTYLLFSQRQRTAISARIKTPEVLLMRAV